MIASISNQQPPWTHTTLNEFCGQRGQSIEPSKTPDSQFELYSVPSFPTRQPEIVSGKEIGSNKQMVTSESVLLCKINPRINRAWVVGHFSPHPKIASTEWIVFPLDKRVEPRFLCYFLQQNAVRDFLASNVSGVGGSLMRVKPSTLRDFPFAYPDRDEQRLIVAEIEKQFSRLDEAVANLKRVKANLKRYKASVLKAAVEGKLTEDWRNVHPDVESASKLLGRILTQRQKSWQSKRKYKEPFGLDTTALPLLPKGWIWAPLEAISNAIGGFAFESKKFTSTGFQVLKMANIRMGRIDVSQKPSFIQDVEADVVVKYGLMDGDLVVTLTGTRKKQDYGYVAVVRNAKELLLNQRIARLRPADGVLPQFLALALQSEDYRNRFFAYETGNVGQGNVGMGAVTKAPITLAPFAEQQQIVAEVERRLSVIEELEAVVEANLTRANRMRQAILRQAFSGKLIATKGGPRAAVEG